MAIATMLLHWSWHVVPLHPDKVITLLAQTSHKLGYCINAEAGAILMDMNRYIHLIKNVYDDDWEWGHHKEHLFHPQKEFNSYH